MTGIPTAIKYIGAIVAGVSVGKLGSDYYTKKPAVKQHIPQEPPTLSEFTVKVTRADVDFTGVEKYSSESHGFETLVAAQEYVGRWQNEPGLRFEIVRSADQKT